MTTTKATALALRRALERNLEPNLVDQHGWTDLHYAAVLNLPGLVNALLWRGAKVCARLPENVATADDVKTLLGGFGVDYNMCSGETPLHLACVTNAALAARALAKNGADIHATLPGVSDWTPLHVAARFNAADAAFVLLLQGANVEHRDEFGAPPLHTAALYNAVDTAEALLAAGASPRAKAKDDLTALHMAAQADSPGVAARLLDHGADVNALSAEEGTSPLDHALFKGARSTADLLRRARRPSHGGVALGHEDRAGKQGGRSRRAGAGVRAHLGAAAEAAPFDAGVFRAPLRPRPDDRFRGESASPRMARPLRLGRHGAGAGGLGALGVALRGRDVEHPAALWVRKRRGECGRPSGGKEGPPRTCSW